MFNITYEPIDIGDKLSKLVKAQTEKYENIVLRAIELTINELSPIIEEELRKIVDKNFYESVPAPRPEVYIRTGKRRESVTAKVTPSKDGYNMDIYFDIDKLNNDNVTKVGFLLPYSNKNGVAISDSKKSQIVLDDVQKYNFGTDLQSWLNKNFSTRFNTLLTKNVKNLGG